MEVKGDYCRLHVRVKAQVKIGQVVAISGSSFSLGSFNKDRIVKLVTTPDSYPIWYTAEPIVLPRGDTVYYKYCLVEGGVMKGNEKTELPRYFIPEDLDIFREDEFLLNSLEGVSGGGDAESDLLEQLKNLTKVTSNVEVGLEHYAKRSSRLFFNCYHLPVNIRRTNRPNEPFEVTWGESLIAKSENSVAHTMKTMWVGTISVNHKTLSSDEQQFLIEKLRSMDCIPVFLDDEVAHSAYHGFCKTVMWPVFHNVDQLDHIHAAWNLETELDKTGVKSSDNLNSSGNGAAAEEQRSKFYEDKTLEWNKKESESYDSYMKMNQVFAQTMLDVIRDGDVIWVHDYHLMLLPKLLREQNVRCVAKNEPVAPKHDIKVIFFLHIPFPTSQIFRTLTKANELLHSMTCSDVVGFHAFDHARHFLTASKRMLGIRSFTRAGGMLTLMVQDREVIVTMSHVSIEAEKIDRAVQEEETQAMARAIREKYKGRKIIVGMDVCQRLSGGALKLAAFDKLLTDYNVSDMGGVVLIQRCIRQGSRQEDEDTTSKDMRRMVADINHKYTQKMLLNSTRSSRNTSAKTAHNRNFLGNSSNNNSGSALNSGVESPAEGAEEQMVVDYEEITTDRGATLNERVALWLSADVFLLTPIREGLNLMPLEFIQARKDLPNAGVVVVSEFSTCSSLLNGSLKVNPFAPQSVADTLEKALNMPAKDCEYRRERDLNFIKSHPSSLWAEQILNDLEQLQNNKSVTKVSPLKFPEPLNVPHVVRAYDTVARQVSICDTGSRVFIFDYGGTLLPKEKYDIYIKQTLSAIDGRRPSEHIMECLRRLSEDPRNVVMVVTGLTKLKLGTTFKDLPNVTLVTSNGLVYSWGANLDNPIVNTCTPGTLEDDNEVTALQTPTMNQTSSLAEFSSLTSTAPRDGERRCRADSLTSMTGGDDGRDWEFLDCNINWKIVSDIALPIITKFTFRTNGTCLSPRIPGIGWSYFGADPEWGEKQASQLKIELEAALAHHDVKVTSLIQGSLEVVPRSLHKGILVKSLLHKVARRRGGRLPGFALLLGDEESDDKMFTALYDVIAQAPANAEVRRMKAFTVSVGKRVTPAHFYVNDVEDVEGILTALAGSEHTTASTNASTAPSNNASTKSEVK